MGYMTTGEMTPEMMEMAQKGQKRKGVTNEDPKSKLAHGVVLWLLKNKARSCLNKTDITYEVQAFGEGAAKQYQATVTLTEVDGGTSFAGEVSADKKKAEASAATLAFE